MDKWGFRDLYLSLLSTIGLTDNQLSSNLKLLEKRDILYFFYHQKCVCTSATVMSAFRATTNVTYKHMSMFVRDWIRLSCQVFCNMTKISSKQAKLSILKSLIWSPETIDGISVHHNHLVFYQSQPDNVITWIFFYNFVMLITGERSFEIFIATAVNNLD